MPKLVLVVLLVCVFLMPPVLAVQAAPRPAEGPRLVIFAPWTDGLELVHRAGGDILGPYQPPFGVLAYQPDDDEFDRRIRALGAWAVLDGTSLAWLCGIEPEPNLEGTATW